MGHGLPCRRRSGMDGLPSIAEGRRPARVTRQLDPNYRTNPSGSWHGRMCQEEKLLRLQGSSFPRYPLAMVDPVSTTISVLALVISGITMWMNVLRRGALRMTRPTFI